MQINQSNTFWAWCPSDLEIPNDILKFVGFGFLVFASRGNAVSLVNFLSNCRHRNICYRLKMSFQTLGQGVSFLGDLCDKGRWRSGKTHHPISHLPHRLILGIKGFQCRDPLIILPFVQLTCHRQLQTVKLNFQSGVPGNFYRTNSMLLILNDVCY